MSKKKSAKKPAKAAKESTKQRWPKMLADDTQVEETPIEEVTPETETEVLSDSNELNLEFAEDDGADESLEFTSDDDSGITADSGDDTEVEIETSADGEEDRMSAAGVGEISDEDDNDDVDDKNEAVETLEASGENTGESGEQTNDQTEDENDEPADELGLDNSELGSFEAAQIEDFEMITNGQLRSIIESILFTTEKPISIAVIKQAFKGTQIKSKDIREALHTLSEEYNSSDRGFTLDEIAGGFQLRTKADNLKYLRQGVKARPFRLSGPALEVLSIIAYKQPTTKHQIDEIRGVESGHLLRALMEKHLLTFGERSDLPGKPMFYETTRKFLEIFGLRNLQELPSLHEIDQLIPEGIGGDEEKKKETLSDLTGELSETVGSSYSVGEEELLKITDELSTITTSSDFFEQEKERQRQKRDADRAQDIREKQIVGEEVEKKDVRWLERYDAAQAAAAQGSDEVEFVTEGLESEGATAEVESAEVSEPVAQGEMADIEVGDVETVPEEGLAMAGAEGAISEQHLDAMLAEDEVIDEAEVTADGEAMTEPEVSIEAEFEQEALSDDGGVDVALDSDPEKPERDAEL